MSDRRRIVFGILGGIGAVFTAVGGLVLFLYVRIRRNEAAHSRQLEELEELRAEAGDAITWLPYCSDSHRLAQLYRPRGWRGGGRKG